MPKQARFYVIEKNTRQGGLSAEEALACDLAANAWRLGKKVLIACETEQQALELDLYRVLIKLLILCRLMKLEKHKQGSVISTCDS